MAEPLKSRHEIWSLRHPLRRIPRGKILRIILVAEATVMWSTDQWATTNKSSMTNNRALNLWFGDLPTEQWPGGSVIDFTLFWKDDQRWEGRNWKVSVE